jgi:hypothetical protein
LNVAASSSPQCGGTLKTTPLPRDTFRPDGDRWNGWTYDVTLSGASLTAGGSCIFSVPVIAESAGQMTVGADGWGSTTDDSLRSSNWTYAVLTVPAIATPASVTSAFTPDTVPDNGTTTWTVQIVNPNTSTTLTDVRFLAWMPVTHIGLTPEAITGDDCGGNGTLVQHVSVATLDSPSVKYRGGSIAPGAQCRITVSMSVDWYPFDQDDVRVTVISNEGGESPVSTARITELAPPEAPVPDPTAGPVPTPTKPPSNAFTHTKPKVARDGTITETVKLPAKGIVRLRESWRGKLIAHVQRTVRTSGKVTIKLVPSAATRRALKSHRAATLKLSVAYTPAGGQTRTVKLTARTRR